MPTCPRCNSEVEEGVAVCPTCGFNMSEGSLPGGGGGDNPWEQRSEVGFARALMDTVKMVITNPVEFYGTLKKDGDWGSPIIYAIIVGWIGAILSFVWQFLFQSMMTLPIGGKAGVGSMMASGGMMLIFVVLFPIFLLIGMFIWAGLLHLAGMILGDAEQGFEVTFKVVAYTTTTNLANIIPMCGGVLGGIWALILTMIGLKQAHRTEPWKAILSPVLVMVLCCVCVILLYVIGAASIIGMLGASGALK